MMDYFELKDEFEAQTLKYDALFDSTLDDMEFDSRMLKEALKCQMSLMVQWEVMTKKFNYLYDECEVLVDEEYGNALKLAMKDKYREITISEAKEYAKANATYKTVRRLMNKIRHSRDESRGLLESVHSRKYIMNNMVQSIVASVENHIL